MLIIIITSREAELAQVIEGLLLHLALYAELAQIEVHQLGLRLARDAQGGRSLAAAVAVVGMQRVHDI